MLDTQQLKRRFKNRSTKYRRCDHAADVFAESPEANAAHLSRGVAPDTVVAITRRPRAPLKRRSRARRPRVGDAPLACRSPAARVCRSNAALRSAWARWETGPDTPAPGQTEAGALYLPRQGSRARTQPGAVDNARPPATRKRPPNGPPACGGARVTLPRHRRGRGAPANGPGVTGAQGKALPCGAPALRRRASERAEARGAS